MRDDSSILYLWAVTEVKKHHGRFVKFKNFVQSEFKVII